MPFFAALEWLGGQVLVALTEKYELRVLDPFDLVSLRRLCVCCALHALCALFAGFDGVLFASYAYLLRVSFPVSAGLSSFGFCSLHLRSRADL
jgi:hypothetical protein